MAKITPLFQKPLPRSYFYATLVIVVLNLLFFLATEIDSSLLGMFALNPISMVGDGAWWQAITYLYVHGDLNHLLFNTIFFLIAGLKVEDTMGSWEFLVYYNVCGVLAGLLSLGIYWATGQTSAFLLGSSGAVFAVIFAYAVYGYDGRTLFVPLAFFVILDGIQFLAHFLQSGSILFSPDTLIHLVLLAAMIYFVFRPDWNRRASNIVIFYAAFEVFSQIFNPYGGVAHLTHLAGFVFAFVYLLVRLRVNAWKEFWAS